MGKMGRAFDGGYAEYTLLPNEQIHPVETTLSIEKWAALPETYFTAYGSMKKLKLTDVSLLRRCPMLTDISKAAKAMAKWLW